MKRSLLSLTITWRYNVDEFFHQIKEMKHLRRIENRVQVPANKEEIVEMYIRVFKLNQHPYLYVFFNLSGKYMVRPDEEFIVASNDQWEETFSKEKKMGTFLFQQCASCEERDGL